MNDLYGRDVQTAVALEVMTKAIPVGHFVEAYEDAGPIVAFMAIEGAHDMNGQFIAV
jgi:hypothetical protein